MRKYVNVTNTPALKLRPVIGRGRAENVQQPVGDSWRDGTDTVAKPLSQSVVMNLTDKTDGPLSQDRLADGQKDFAGQQVLEISPQNPLTGRACMVSDDQQFFTAWDRGLVRGLSAMLRAQQIRRANSS